MNIAIATGGTGGHIYPALALAKKLKQNGHEVIFIGTNTRMEKDIVPKENFKFYGLPIEPLKSVNSFRKMFVAIFKTKQILKHNNIDIVIGFGNYISIPSLIAAKLLRKKIYIQEQNLVMGKANKFISKYCSKVFLAFEQTLKTVPNKLKDKFVITGNPLREQFYNITKEKARQILNIDENTKVISIMGGSLGAKSINDAVIKNMNKINEKQNFRIFLATGKNLYKETTYDMKDQKNITLMSYFEDSYNYIAASDLVVCRAGASTISELIELKKPSILIPYDFVGQKDNADMMEFANAAKVFPNDKAYDAIVSAIDLVEKDTIVEFMQRNIEKLNYGNAVEQIVKIIEEENE